MIRVKDDFFEEKMFAHIKKHVTTQLIFEPRYFDNPAINPEGERSKEQYYGSRFDWNNDKKLLDIFVKQAENAFRLKVKKLHSPPGGIDIRNLDHFKPHTDDGKLNILVMIGGPTAVTNGTVFYTDGELDIHVGFRENRAVLFPSNWWHSQHASNVPNLKRYTSTLFIKDYEE